MVDYIYLNTLNGEAVRYYIFALNDTDLRANWKIWNLKKYKNLDVN